VPYVITAECEKDQSCVVVCPVDCIHEGEDTFYIEQSECIECGLCLPECPVSAVIVLADAPPAG
jgi:NAD-dependent dihydropyrimidine dehydrogenase PreA subunit